MRYWDIAQQIAPPASAPPPGLWDKLFARLVLRTPKTVTSKTAGSPSPLIDQQALAALMAPALRAPDAGAIYPRTVHCISSLGAGGAERQLVNLLVRLHERGHADQTLLTINPLEGVNAHYKSLLGEHSIELRSNNQPIREEGVDLIRRNPDKVALIRRLPDAFNAWTLDLWVELSLLGPDIAHFWLDHPNVWGAPAALLADIPAVILSTRNVNPSNFPYLYMPYMLDWYKVLARSTRVHFINNSRPGRDSYAEWLGIPAARFAVVVNGVELKHMTRATDEERVAIRDEIGVPRTALAVVGAFRLSEEKRPELFVETFARARARRPDLHGVLMGEGPLLNAVLARAEALGVSGAFHATGRRNDVAKVMSSMDIFLHTAWWEGTPNVVLEAQQLMLPVVVSNGGGAADAVDHGVTGLLIERTDENAFAEALVEVLSDLEGWRSKAQRGPQFIAERFDIDRMVDETLAVQRRAVSGDARTAARALEEA